MSGYGRRWRSEKCCLRSCVRCAACAAAGGGGLTTKCNAHPTKHACALIVPHHSAKRGARLFAPFRGVSQVRSASRCVLKHALFRRPIRFHASYPPNAFPRAFYRARFAWRALLFCCCCSPLRCAAQPRTRILAAAAAAAASRWPPSSRSPCSPPRRLLGCAAPSTRDSAARPSSAVTALPPTPTAAPLSTATGRGLTQTRTTPRACVKTWRRASRGRRRRRRRRRSRRLRRRRHRAPARRRSRTTQPWVMSPHEETTAARPARPALAPGPARAAW